VLERLGPITIGVVVVAACFASPSPGLHGDSLIVTVALVAFAASGIMLGAPHVSSTTTIAALLLLTVASAVLVAAQSNGPGYVGLFMVAAAAPLLLPGWRGIAVVTAACAVLAAITLANDTLDGTGSAFIIIGMIAFAVMGGVVRQLADRNTQVETLLVERDESREAQAAAATREAALAERQRIAREVHDVLAHSMSGLVLQLDAAQILAARERASAPLLQSIDRARDLARAGLDESRRSVGMLRGGGRVGPERIAELATEFERDTHTTCALVVNGTEVPLDTERRLTLFRVAQEALTNVRKHARAERVELRLGYEDNGTRLIVEDFAATAVATHEQPVRDHPEDHRRGGYGLAGMRERAELLGGTLTASAGDQGFRVELWLPVAGSSCSDTESPPRSDTKSV
jgi:signal transduction histidine kinase